MVHLRAPEDRLDCPQMRKENATLDLRGWPLPANTIVNRCQSTYAPYRRVRDTEPFVVMARTGAPPPFKGSESVRPMRP